MEFKAEDSQPGFKYDEGKPMMSLLDPGALREIAKVMTYGAKKYSKLNWRKGMDWSRCADAALRHIFQWLDGEDRDEESGLYHLAHAACCLIFLIFYQMTGKGKDDRYKTALRELDEEKGQPKPIVPNGGDIVIEWVKPTAKPSWAYLMGNTVVGQAAETIHPGDVVSINEYGKLERTRITEKTDETKKDPSEPGANHGDDWSCDWCLEEAEAQEQHADSKAKAVAVMGCPCDQCTVVRAREIVGTWENLAARPDSNGAKPEPKIYAHSKDCGCYWCS